MPGKQVFMPEWCQCGATSVFLCISVGFCLVNAYIHNRYLKTKPTKEDKIYEMDCAVVCEERMIWFEGMPVVVSDELMAAGIFYV